MPFYRFKVEARLGSQAAMARVAEIVAPPRSFFEQGYWSCANTGLPFVGKVEGSSFRVRRCIQYRNAFLPLIWGRVTGESTETRVSVTMFLHPAVALFMVLWFWGIGAAVVSFSDAAGPLVLLPVGLLAFGVVLLCGGFFPEAIKARRVLEQALSEPGA
jgi:hypothetical protein